MVCNLGNGLMKASVALGIGAQIRRALVTFHFCDDSAQPSDSGLVDSPGRLSCCERFQDGAALEDLVCFLRRNEADASALIPFVYDEPFLLEQCQRRANRRPFRLKLFRE